MKPLSLSDQILIWILAYLLVLCIVLASYQLWMFGTLPLFGTVYDLDHDDKMVVFNKLGLGERKVELPGNKIAKKVAENY